MVTACDSIILNKCMTPHYHALFTNLYKKFEDIGRGTANFCKVHWRLNIMHSTIITQISHNDSLWLF